MAASGGDGFAVSMRLLIVEDDPVIGPQVSDLLRAEGWAVDLAVNGDDGLENALERTYSLAILDVMLPGQNGFQLCAALRKLDFPLPILMLTAKDSVDDRVFGLEAGADDYLVKPFDPRELVARVRALLRRESAKKTGVLQVADLAVDTRDRKVTRAGKEISLTRREFELLEALVRNAGRILTRETILERVWNADEKLENTVNFHVASLRKKVDADFGSKLIHTVHGFGYTLKSGEGSS
jgi:two-component system copper resistance phosphate regulon response regulator CusR